MVGFAVRTAQAIRDRIKATVGVFNGDLLVDRKLLNFNRSSERQRFLKDLKSEKGLTLADSALVMLEEYIREQLPRQISERASSTPTELEQPNAAGATADLSPAAQALLEDPNLLERLKAAFEQWGWVGDPRPPLLAYVAFTSRLLSRPINLAFVSQAATGKNTAVDAARALMPETAYYLQRAGSEKSLIYVDEPFQYKVVIFAEADSIPDEGPAASAIRSLASDNVLAYDVPEQNPDTNKFQTRRINKPGPTGLITTSTRSLQHQLGTRVLECHLHDDPRQTRLIMRAQARAVSGAPAAPLDAGRWIQLQEWLASRVLSGRGRALRRRLVRTGPVDRGAHAERLSSTPVLHPRIGVLASAAAADQCRRACRGDAG